MSDIKISQLDLYPGQPAAADFVPIDKSSSMTTYRASLSSVLASVPVTNVSYSLFANSASQASRSISASHADLADNVSLSGTQWYIPLWSKAGAAYGTTIIGGPNANLIASAISLTSSAFPINIGVYGFDASALDSTISKPAPIHYPYYDLGSWFKPQSWTYSGQGNYFGGLSSGYPILAPFIGTDQMAYFLCTASYSPITTNQFWSGSANSGSYATISSSVDGYTSNIATNLNKKWIRIGSISYFSIDGENSSISMNASRGETAMGFGGGNGFFGRIKLIAGASYSNTTQMLDFDVHDQWWGGGINAQVNYASDYSADIIKAVRLSVWTPKAPVIGGNSPYAPNASGSRDPMMVLDVLVDGLQSQDYNFSLTCLSWGSVRFLREMNVDPPPLSDTGSFGQLYPSQSSYLIFPCEEGFYSTHGGRRNYNIQGYPVTIQPTRNVNTGSAKDNQFVNPYTLNVVGTVGGKGFYSNDNQGQYGTFTQYDPIAAAWKSCVYNGGILVSSSSVASNPATDTVALGTIMAYAGAVAPNNWWECDGRAVLISSYTSLFNAIGNTDSNAAYGYKCDQYGNFNVSGLYFKIPDLRGEFVRGWSHTRNGVDNGRTSASFQAQQVQAHKHIMPYGEEPLENIGIFGGDDTTSNWYGSNGTDKNNPLLYTNDGTSYATATPNPAGIVGNETRPRNVAVMYIIKYTNATNFATSGTTLAGDVTGTVGANRVVAIDNIAIDPTPPTDGQVLAYKLSTNKWTARDIASTSAPGKSFMISNPGGVFGSGDGQSIYVVNNSPTNYRNILKINLTSNVTTYCTYSANMWDIAPRTFYNVLDENYHTYFFASDGNGGGNGMYDFNQADNTLVRIATPGMWFELPISMSFASSDVSEMLKPTIWGLDYSNGSGTNYPNAYYRKVYKNGASWTYTTSPRLALDSISDPQFKFFNQEYVSPSNTANNLHFDYNWRKKRYYYIDNHNGLLHILHQSFGDFTTDWAAANITYDGTFAIPLIGSEPYSDSSTEKMSVDIDPLTGEERGLMVVRRGNTSLTGCVMYIYWSAIDPTGVMDTF